MLWEAHGRHAIVMVVVHRWRSNLAAFLAGGFPEVWHSYSEDDGLAVPDVFPEIHFFQILSE